MLTLLAQLLTEDQPLDNAPFLVEISCYGGVRNRMW